MNDIKLDATKFTHTVQTAGVLRSFGEYTVKITAPSSKSSFMTFEYGIGPKEYDSPREQMKSGINPSEVVCNEGFGLSMKTSNGKTICLTKSTSEVQIQLGWARTF
ncbi:MAG: hypothetical protein PVH93_03150 [Nitrosopumilaceae archaeon]|jgi:hypothetical protein